MFPAGGDAEEYKYEVHVSMLEVCSDTNLQPDLHGCE
jgi:hypothetical protein